MSTSVKDIAASIVLALLFLSLVVIYLVTGQDYRVTGLAVIILAISLIVTIDGDWREVGIIGVLAAIVSLVAVALFGRNLFNTPGVVLFILLWGGLLFFLFNWISRNMVRVPKDRAILIMNTYTGTIYTAKGPISPPLAPIIERKLAVIPLYELGDWVDVQKVNMPMGHNIDLIRAHVNYRIVDPHKAMKGILNYGLVHTTVASEMGKDLNVARTEVEFWERIFRGQITVDVDNAVRDVVFNSFSRASDAYRNREQDAFNKQIRDRVSAQIANWGAQLTGLDLDHFEVDSRRFFDPERETRIKRAEAEREATRIRLVRDAEAAAEAERVKRLVETLKQAGVELSPALLQDIVISAIEASTDWGLEHSYEKLLPGGGPTPGEKRDAGTKK